MPCPGDFMKSHQIQLECSLADHLKHVWVSGCIDKYCMFAHSNCKIKIIVITILFSVMHSKSYLKSINLTSLSRKYFLGKGLGAGDSTTIVWRSKSTSLLKKKRTNFTTKEENRNCRYSVLCTVTKNKNLFFIKNFKRNSRVPFSFLTFIFSENYQESNKWNIHVHFHVNMKYNKVQGLSSSKFTFQGLLRCVYPGCQSGFFCSLFFLFLQRQ